MSEIKKEWKVFNRSLAKPKYHFFAEWPEARDFAECNKAIDGDDWVVTSADSVEIKGNWISVTGTPDPRESFVFGPTEREVELRDALEAQRKKARDLWDKNRELARRLDAEVSAHTATKTHRDQLERRLAEIGGDNKGESPVDKLRKEILALALSEKDARIRNLTGRVINLIKRARAAEDKIALLEEKGELAKEDELNASYGEGFRKAAEQQRAEIERLEKMVADVSDKWRDETHRAANAEGKLDRIGALVSG